jgi:2,4-dienoyl-CoA reductase (NADPH2)
MAAKPAEVLFQPLTIGSLTIANRLVLGPMAVLQPSTDGHPSPQTEAFLTERARGGIGLIIIGGCSATRRQYEESPYKPLLRLDDDRYLPGLQRLTAAVNAHGTPIFAELMPGFGRMAKPSAQWPMIAASPKNLVISRHHLPRGVKAPVDRELPVPREATRDEIQQLEGETAQSALRVRTAGFDGVEIAAHMSYLAASFLSPRTNWRTDEYGGSPENRARILVNIVRGVRELVGPEFPVGLRITVNEHVRNGQGPEDYAAIAAIVAREGLDYVALSDGNYESMDVSTPSTDSNLVNHGEAQHFRRALSSPIVIGSIHDPVAAATAIADGHGDAVMLARPLLADPQYPNKVKEGRIGAIVRCDRDNHCIRRLVLGMPVRCTVNPRMGRESRAAGQRPPAARIARAPVEAAVLSLTGSERAMRFATKLAERKTKAQPLA